MGIFGNLELNNLFAPTELDAQFTVDGITMSRPSNLVENAIEGLSFELA